MKRQMLRLCQNYEQFDSWARPALHLLSCSFNFLKARVAHGPEVWYFPDDSIDYRDIQDVQGLHNVGGHMSEYNTSYHHHQK